jgi:hypothetical protein
MATKKKITKQVIIENPIHVRINSPIAFRKQILTCALESTQLLQDYNEIKEMQEKRRTILVQKLQKTMDTIEKMQRKLELSLPKVKYTQEKQQKIEIKPIETPKQQKIEPKKQESEADKLQKELEEIEQKLAEL